MRITALLITMLVAAGFFWHQTDVQANTRSAWIDGTVSEDDVVTVAFTATGTLNRSVRIVAFDFGTEDSVVEDAYADKIAHGELRDNFYEAGFRAVLIPGSNVLRPILIEPESAARDKKRFEQAIGVVSGMSRTLSMRAS